MAKRTKKQTAATENTSEQTATQQAEPVAQPKSMAELNATLDSMNDETRAQLKALQVPANQLAGTAGKYRTPDGKITDKREEAKLSTNGKPIPAYTPARPAIDGVSATHADETQQLRGRYAQGWGQQVLDACKKRAEQLKRTLSQKERDDVLRKLGDVVPAAWRPRYNRDGITPASQYARHIAVQDEFKAGLLN